MNCAWSKGFLPIDDNEQGKFPPDPLVAEFKEKTRIAKRTN